MPRYIDADALIVRLLDYADVNRGNYWSAGFKNAVTVVEMEETADVVERKRGTWEAVTMGRWIYAKCSVCGTIHDTQTSFCPNCGAEMTERRDDAVF